MLTKEHKHLYEVLLKTLVPSLGRKPDFIIPDFHWEILGNFLSVDNPYVLVVAPVGFSKSTVMKIYAMMELLTGNSRFILYFSSNDQLSKLHFTSFRKMLKNRAIQQVFDYKINKDADNADTIVIRFKGGEEALIKSKGTSSDIQGINYASMRPDLIICDDIDSFDTATSQINTEKLEMWLESELFSRFESIKDRKFRMVNTVRSDFCLTAKALSGSHKYSQWATFKYQALDANDKSIWEAKHPTKYLLLERELMPHTFAANYMNSPLSKDDKLVLPEDLRYYDTLPKITESFMHFDLASKTKEQNDYFAGILLGKASDGMLYVIDIIRTKVDPIQQAYIISNCWQKNHTKHNLTKITIDAIGYQSTLEVWTKKVAIEQGIYPFIEAVHYPKDKFTHFKKHQSLFKTNSIKLPKGHPNLGYLVNELTLFPDSKHDDLVDAFSGAADNFNGKKKSSFLKALLR